MINLDKTKIILASQSPRRSELMRQAGYEFEIIASTIEEKITQTKPNLVVEELSLQKADNVLDMILQSIDLSLMAFDDLSLMIIGADTVVSKNGNIMGKPKGKENAYEMIDSIQGQTHQVIPVLQSSYMILIPEKKLIKLFQNLPTLHYIL